MPNKTVIEWFDQLEGVLESEARLNGLLDHSTTTGNAREFLVTRVLRTILPAGVHIGTGKVIDNVGSCSKQIDIVIYDPRFPLMKVEGGGLYFVEGVLATIEVKSTIDSAELVKSLNNCKSVLDLHVNGEHPEEAAARIAFYAKRGNLSQREAEHRFWYMFRPATYTFAFASKLSFHTTYSSVKDWWESIDCAHSAFFPLLPRVMTAGNVVAFVNDGRVTLNSSSGSQHVMSVFATSRRFRWFAVHLMDSVSLRLGLRNFAEKFDYKISNYFPWDDYVNEIQKAETVFIGRKSKVEIG